MKFIAYRVALAINSFLFAACVYGGESLPSASTNTSPQMTQPSKNGEAERAAALRAAFQHADKQAKDRANGVPPPPSEFPFPAPDAGPHRPPPSYVNLYGVNDHYPDYLECIYDVDEKNYNQSKEPKWFIESLKQTRHFGPEKFPPIKWIAVIIQNRAEHKDASTFEQSFKVGTIFRASDVFDSSRDLSQLVTKATMDRHPFKYEQPQSNRFVGEQRWLIVEQHVVSAATPNNARGRVKSAAE